MQRQTYFTFFCFFCALSSAFAEPIVLTSGDRKPDVIELYTSEGCSSCPPADQWLNSLTDNAELFSTVIPLAFHVDYWNWLGWRDDFSQKQFTERQYLHVKRRNLSQAYTPAFVVNNKEWRGWFSGERSWPSQANTAKRLTVSVDGENVVVDYDSPENLIVNVALLGMGIESKIGNGENRGRTLEHNFVVLALQSQRGESTWQFERHSLDRKIKPSRLALVAWVSELDNVSIRQAVGGFLTN